MVVASFSDLDLVQTGYITFKLIDRDSGFALTTFTNVENVDALVIKVRALLHE